MTEVLVRRDLRDRQIGEDLVETQVEEGQLSFKGRDFRKTNPADTYISDFCSPYYEKINSCCSCHPGHGALLWQL